MASLVRYVPRAIDLDLTQDDLGYPELPDLFDEVYAKRLGRQGRGVLQCPECLLHAPECPEWMYLQMRYRRLVEVHLNGNIGEHPDANQSPEHKALNERTHRAAENAGLTATLESASSTRDRITDVLVRGAVGLAVETQFWYQTVAMTKKPARLRYATV